MRITNLDTHAAEETTVANVTVNKATNPSAGTVVVSGTAFNADGSAMDLASIEQRFVNSQKFSNGTRTLSRAHSRHAHRWCDARFLHRDVHQVFCLAAT